MQNSVKGKKLLFALKMISLTSAIVFAFFFFLDKESKEADSYQFAGTDSDNKVVATLSTDKEVYEAGEPVKYRLDVTNERGLWTIRKSEFKLSTGYFVHVPEEPEFVIPETPYGETATITGTLIRMEYADNYVEPETIEKSGSRIIFAVLSGCFLVLAIVLFILDGVNKRDARTIAAIVVLCGISWIGTKAYADGSTDAKLRPYVTIMYGGEETTFRATIDLKMKQETMNFTKEQRVSYNRITCHDPSIFKDFDGTYYVIGTHITGSYSTDLVNWTNIDSTIREGYNPSERGKVRMWNNDNPNGDWFGYLWAPDIVYNPNLEKYCVYLSADGDDWISNIVMLTADAVTGPYTYAGTVVYGGFTADTYTDTDLTKATGETQFPERYVTHGVKNKKWGDEYPNCIDPCTFFDEEGNLWMSYGSWSGGIFILKLDPKTGLRDYTVSYETNAHSDAYFGTKIAGGKYVTGEGSYIQHIGDYYYLFISYGGLEAKGGYNVRVFRSTRPDGDYVDALGNTPYYDKYVLNVNQSVGVRLMGGYRWRTYYNGEVAQGHNSAFVDDDGRAFMVYHTRTTDGTEGHYVKVHQLFVNREGWIVLAPYQTNGEAMQKGSVKASDIAGDWEVILHSLDLKYKDLETHKSEMITLNEDGTITGAYEGSWKLDETSSYIDIFLDDVDYSGVTLSMNIEYTNVSTYVFTCLGVENQLTLWGSKIPKLAETSEE